MLNIGIVGGGIAGLYCARELGPNHKITLFETLSRLGGRIETLKLSGFNAECGPMRFELGTQPLVAGLISKMELETETFPPTGGHSADFPKYLLARHEMSTKHLRVLKPGNTPEDDAKHSHHTTALQLLKFGIYRLLNDGMGDSVPEIVEAKDERGFTKIEKLADSFGDESDQSQRKYNEIRTRAKLGQHFLWTFGFWNAMARVLSPGALAKLRDTGTFYHLFPENPSASEWTIFWLRLSKSSPKGDLTAVKTGVGSIVEHLQTKLEGMPNVEIIELATVTEVSSHSKPGKLILRASVGPRGAATGKMYSDFDHVIFALPARPLQKLMQPFPKRVQGHLQGVIPFTLLKVFIVIREPWWTEIPEPQTGAHLLATREIHYQEMREGTNHFGMILLYMDRPAVSYWQPFITSPHEEAQQDETEELRREIVRQLSFLWPNKIGASDLSHRDMVDDHIISFAIRDWSHAPFLAACHAWAGEAEDHDAEQGAVTHARQR